MTLAGVVTGFSGYAYFSRFLEGGEGYAFRVVPVLMAVTAAIAGLFAFQHLAGRLVRWLLQDEALFRRYRNHSYLGFLPVLLSGLVFTGFQLSLPFLYLLLITCALAHGIHLWALVSAAGTGKGLLGDIRMIPVLFFISGFSALIYEIVWQRVLFYYYGVNIESITIVVAIFMLGLGIGSLLGGYAADWLRGKLPHLFIACELSIGLFGLFSIPLIHFVGKRTIHLSVFPASLVILCLLLLPTIAMGATLPVLVKYLFNKYRHVGRSTGTLYFANTIGGGVSCLLTVDFLFTFLSLQHCVTLAALLNIGISCLLVYYVNAASNREGAAEKNETTTARIEVKTYNIPLSAALGIAFVTGYLSLSQELVWVRIVSITAWGIAPVFGQILGLFLIGIALGARSAERYCRNPHMAPLTRIGALLVSGGLGYFGIIALFINIAALSKLLSIAMAYISIIGVAFVFGNIFPIVCHFGIHSGNRVGKSVSWIYLLNICGSTLGPLVTGFYLLDVLPIYTIIALIAGLSITFGLFVWLFSGARPAHKVLVAAVSALAVAFLFSVSPRAYHRMYEKLQSGKKYKATTAYSQVIETRSGVVTVEPDSAGDIVWGGGVYDGRFNVDPVLNSNGIQRAFLISGLHPNPREVLEVGLSTGSWAWVFLKFGPVEHLDIVEINPGYLEMIRVKGTPFTDILSDPKVSIHIDDGRRWLQRHPGRQFDLIVMNTTYHFRAFSSALLSRQFLQMVKRHLREGGVLYWNTTGSDDVVYTAAKSFNHVVQVGSFVAASDFPIAVDRAARRRLLLSFEDGGRPLLDTAHAVSNWLADTLANYPLQDIRNTVLNTPGLREITDANMLTEYKSFAEAVPLKPIYEWRNSRRPGGVLRGAWKVSLF